MVCSALLDNVTTVLLTVPITFSITAQLKVDVKPYLISQILASNIGGTATLIGDPPNIMIGSAVKQLTFMSFIENLAPIVFFNLVVVLAIVAFVYRKGLHTTPELQSELMQMDEKKALKNRGLLMRCLLVLLLVGVMTTLVGRAIFRQVGGEPQYAASQLQRDLLLIWQQRYAHALVPVNLHADEAMAEALAAAELAGRYEVLQEAANG